MAMGRREVLETLHSSLMTCADYFEAVCLRRVKIERKRLLADSIVMEPTAGRQWLKKRKRRQTQKRKAKR